MPKKPIDLTFETALERLECLIESMENGDTPLADLVKKFEEGSTLITVSTRSQSVESESSYAHWHQGLPRTVIVERQLAGSPQRTGAHDRGPIPTLSPRRSRA